MGIEYRSGLNAEDGRQKLIQESSRLEAFLVQIQSWMNATNAFEIKRYAMEYDDWSTIESVCLKLKDGRSLNMQLIQAHQPSAPESVL